MSACPTLVIWELYQKNPIVDVRLFGHFNFATSSMMMFVVGGMSFATTVLVPQFLQANMGYTAESAGMVLSAAGFVLLGALPFIGMLAGRFQGRYLIAAGWLLLTGSMFLSTRRIDLLISFSSATWLRIAQYAPLGLVFIPTTAAAYYGMPKEKNNAIAGLVNFMRNIGASVGTSVVTTVLARRDQFHQERIGSNLTAGNPAFRSMVNGLAEQLRESGFSAHDALNHAYGQVYRTLQYRLPLFPTSTPSGSDGSRRLHVLPDVLPAGNDPAAARRLSPTKLLGARVDDSRRLHVLPDILLAEERSARRREGHRPLSAGCG